MSTTTTHITANTHNTLDGTHQKAAVETPTNASVSEAVDDHIEREDYSGMSATYSPEDNKLRLRSVSRLSKALYARVRAAGFIWAPKQELFVAPAWTPTREDLLIELCGCIDDEDTSLVERAEERADRFEGYSVKRAQDATAAHSAVQSIGKRFEFGQPILVGHYSERKARKDAERMDNGMRRAVSMWDTSAYWKDRAAGALAHAKYKELPRVRARRIKTIEAGKRKQERIISEASELLRRWQLEGLTPEQALLLAGVSSSYRCYPLADFPRDPPASQHEGLMSLWSALEDGVITVEQARAQRLRALPANIAWAQRWIDHYENRLTYERAMLQEQGGLLSERFNLEVGGRVLIRGEWLTVVRVNKSAGRISSVTTNARFVRIRPVEEISDYQAPVVEVAEKVQAAMRVAPLANYPGEGLVHITKAEWEAIGKDYRGTSTFTATEMAGRHRVRRALGVFLPRLEIPESADRTQRMNYRHHSHHVYITDVKRTDPPAAPVDHAQTPAIPAPEPVRASPPAVAISEPVAEPEGLAQMRAQLRHGVTVQVVHAPQLFPTPRELAARMVELADIEPGMRVLEPSAGTGRILEQLPEGCEVLAVEINSILGGRLDATGRAVVIGDFLECTVESLKGTFDRVVMNPPFANADDIKHIRHAMDFLKPGGKLVAICANGPRQNDRLRPLVEQHGGEWEDLPLDTFKDEGTGVRTALLTIAV